ncbi:MAG: ArsC family reductase [Rickettsiaceae bacterium]|nr:ArsC family reductase [Rickettsiaceae bacterium]
MKNISILILTTSQYYFSIMIKLYGIKNCDTVKKAMKWMADNGIEYQFHDYKKDGVDKAKLTEFVKKFGFEKLINRKGTTWRQLGEVEQKKITNDQFGLELMQEKPSIIKRPILDLGSKQLIGFDVDEYESEFGV